MRKLTIAASMAVVLAAHPALAGGMTETVMPIEVVETKTSSSAAGIIVPLLLIILIAVAASGSSNGTPTPQ